MTVDRTGTGLIAAFALVATIVACTQEPPHAPAGGTSLKGTVALVSPTAGERFAQNNPAIGCASHPARGYGFRIAFDWHDVEGAQRYRVQFKHTGAQYSAVEYTVEQSEYAATWCNAFVIDANLDNWIWRVAAVGTNDADTLWSEQRAYGFKPCRLQDSIPTPCYAPPP